MPSETYTPWESAETQLAYLHAVLEENDPDFFVEAVGTVARHGHDRSGPRNPPGPTQPAQSAVGRARPLHRHSNEGAWGARRPSYRRPKSSATRRLYRRDMERNVGP